MSFDDFGDILFPSDVMLLLGIGKNTFLKLIHSGQLPAFRVGKQWRISKAELITFVNKSNS